VADLPPGWSYAAKPAPTRYAITDGGDRLICRCLVDGRPIYVLWDGSGKGWERKGQSEKLEDLI
jgi:hypothetical protein